MDDNFGPVRQRQRSGSQQKNRQRSVVFYIAFLFAAAFVLLLLSFMMERRQNAESISDLSQSLSGLRESVSAMQSVQTLYDENTALKDQIKALEGENAALKQEVDKQATLVGEYYDDLQNTIKAMDLFWQIDEAYVRGRTKLCRELIQTLEDAGLADALPADSTTNNDRYSPKDRYREIFDALY